MQAVILAGGYGTRIAEESHFRPKPMIEIGGRPILWHIMKTYSYYGINEFVILLGYKGYYIKEYFANYFLHQSDVTIDMSNGDLEVHNNTSEPWKVTLLDTGLNAMTGARIKKAKAHIGNEPFMLTYGDGLADIDLEALLRFHKSHGKYATLTATYPPGRFGALDLKNKQVKSFKEKPRGDGGKINGGYFILSPKIFSLLENDDTIWEEAPLIKLAENGQLMAYQHEGFWQPMDTLRDKQELQELWDSGNAPWRQWS